MRALRETLERSLDELRIFLGSPDIRALHVKTTPQLLPTLVGAFAACEHKGGNTSPMMLLVSRADSPERGWTARTAELRDEYRDLAKAAADADVQLDPLPAESTAAGLAGFAASLAGVVRGIRDPLGGVILLITPGVASPELAGDVRALLEQAPLKGARWILVESGNELRTPVLSLEHAGMSIDAVPDEDALARELAQRAESAAAAPSGAGGTTAAGGAGPGIPAPRRPHEAAPVTFEERTRIAAQAGLPAAYVDPEITHALRVASARASAAAAQRDFAGAIDQFKIARDLCERASLPREAAVHELMMGALALSSSPRTAAPVFASARERALAANDRSLAARAEVGRASALFASGQLEESAEAYRAAAELGAGSDRVMAIDSYRMCGQVLIRLGREELAVAAWRRALALADAASKTERCGTGAAAVARAVADVCERHSLTAQASAMRQQALALEAPPDPAMLEPSVLLPNTSGGA